VLITEFKYVTAAIYIVPQACREISSTYH